MTPLTAEDQLLRKTLQTEEGWTVDRMIVEFLLKSVNGICCLISYKELIPSEMLKG